MILYKVFFLHWYPLKVPSSEKSILARLGVSRPNYVNVDSPNLGFPYFNYLGGYQREEGNVESQFQLDLKISKSNLFAKLSRVGEP